jgi:hypothetical protein
VNSDDFDRSVSSQIAADRRKDDAAYSQPYAEYDGVTMDELVEYATRHPDSAAALSAVLGEIGIGPFMAFWQTDGEVISEDTQEIQRTAPGLTALVARLASGEDSPPSGRFEFSGQYRYWVPDGGGSCVSESLK